MTNSMAMTLTSRLPLGRLRSAAMACGFTCHLCCCGGAVPPPIAPSPASIEPGPAAPVAGSPEVASKAVEPSLTEPSAAQATVQGQHPECPDDYVKCMQTGPEAKCRKQYAACGGHLY